VTAGSAGTQSIDRGIVPLREEEERQSRRVVVFVTMLAVVAVALVTQLTLMGSPVLPTGDRWIPALLFAVLLFVGETQPRLWMRFGDEGEVTPGWAFAYALVLLDMPLGAVVVMTLTNLFIDSRYRKGILKTAYNVSQGAVSLSVSGLILHAFGVRDGLLGVEDLPIAFAAGILLAGMATLLVNCTLLTVVVCLHTGMGPATMLRRSYFVSIAADGALLALAPVFVIAIEYSSLMIPLLAITSFLVYQSARNALRNEHEANHDPLTMLLNRRAFDEQLANAVDEATDDRQTLLLVMDLDRFKDINDRLGHPVGDRLLRSFAERLERILPARAVASRLGGDEFAVLLPGVAGQASAMQLVRRWHNALSEPHELAGFPLTSAVSIGVALAPEHGRSGTALMAAADVAMYRAKQHRTGVELAVHADGANEVGRVGLLADLREAFGSNQLHSHYQPIVRLSDGTIESVEALIRWRHPIHGDIPPNEFIGMTEHTDLIGPLTETMFRNSMRDMLAIGDECPRLCLNVAARNLIDRQFAPMVISVMESLGFPAAKLEIEITERDIVTNSERSRLALTTLRRHGVAVAIDDFGTGYSSFLTLRDLDADRLKIDQQFTSNIINSSADELIVRKLIEIAHALGLEVVAEGVESFEVWDRLKQLDCDVVQGYAIARPMPLSELRAWIKTHSTEQASPAISRARLEVVAS
jgi:diguanylate cyclase (GGDEF)-like protein